MLTNYETKSGGLACPRGKHKWQLVNKGKQAWCPKCGQYADPAAMRKDAPKESVSRVSN